MRDKIDHVFDALVTWRDGPGDTEEAARVLARALVSADPTLARELHTAAKQRDVKSDGLGSSREYSGYCLEDAIDAALSSPTNLREELDWLESRMRKTGPGAEEAYATSFILLRALADSPDLLAALYRAGKKAAEKEEG